MASGSDAGQAADALPAAHARSCVFPSDARAIHDSLGSADKTLEFVRGQHYFEGDDAALTDVVDLIAAWTAQRLG